MPLIAPSILSADFANMESDCRSVLEASALAERADLLHLDVMDGHFVPNLTMGPDMCRALRRSFPAVFLDVHLMVTNPERFVDPFVDAGADHLTFHVEPFAAVAGSKPEWKSQEIRRLAERIRQQGVSVGLAINPPTPIGGGDEAADGREGHGGGVLGLLDAFEMILVMSVHPGRSGQSFIADVLEKTRAISAELEPTQRLEMDGGIGEGTGEQVLDAGCDVLVAASAIFGKPREERGGVIRRLRGRA